MCPGWVMITVMCAGLVAILTAVAGPAAPLDARERALGRWRLSMRTWLGAAVVDFVLVMMLLVPLVLGIAQVGLVLHVRNTLTAAASEGARASAPLGATPADGVERARR